MLTEREEKVLELRKTMTLKEVGYEFGITYEAVRRIEKKAKIKLNKLNQIIEKYGKWAQKIVAIEELSELIKEITKDFRNKLNKDNLVEEMADVELMLSQLKIIYDVKQKDINKIIEGKIERTLAK